GRVALRGWKKRAFNVSQFRSPGRYPEDLASMTLMKTVSSKRAKSAVCQRSCSMLWWQLMKQ
ncbi:unnamed protein product, partial [Heterosigma akashiwo]